MHSPLILAAAHAARSAHLGHLAAIATALIVGAVIVIILKIIARILTPGKRAARRPSSPYAAQAGRK